MKLTCACGATGEFRDGIAGAADARQWHELHMQYCKPRTVTLPITDAMIDAYLRANTAYWTETDEMPHSNPSVWRNGTVREATQVSLTAALRAAGVEATK